MIGTEIPVLAVQDISSASGNIQVVPIGQIWEQITALSWLQAVVAISFGIIYLIYGWRIFKIIVVIVFGMLGMTMGMYTGRHMGSEIWGGVAGLFLMSFVSIPLMKWAVCVLGGVAGGIVTGGLWYAFELPQQYLWAGAIIGVVAGGMISFIVLKAAVMLFTSLGGGTIIIIGLLSLLYRYELHVSPSTNHIETLVRQQNWFLPVLLYLLMLVGIIIQHISSKGPVKLEI